MMLISTLTVCVTSSVGDPSVAVRRLPSKPRRPIAVNNRGIYVTVKWTRPEDDDEAADVTGYVIKYCGKALIYLAKNPNIDDDGEVHVDGIKTRFRFTFQLKRFMSYQFAVAANNNVGRGEFSEFSYSVKTSTGK